MGYIGNAKVVNNIHHAFRVVSGNLLWYKDNDLAYDITDDLRAGAAASGFDPYDMVIVGSPNQTYSIDSNGDLVVTY
tara:strand:- start:837 stop:1067 length:231 start_codon:yes stop_codon:yes gene_type:complete